MKIIPLFTSAYNFKSTLLIKKNVETPKVNSIQDIVEENNIEKVFLIEENMAGVLEAKKVFKEKLCFGLKINLVNSLSDFNEKEDKDKLCKIILMAKNSDGYKILTKIFSIASSNLSYPVIDMDMLNKYWSDSLYLAIPFYDSFIFVNSFTFNNLIFNFNKFNPIFFLEDNGLFFDQLIRDNVKAFCESNNFKTLETKSIYYKNKSNFIDYLTNRCIQNRNLAENPNVFSLSSDKFCIESWKEKNGQQ